MSAKMDARIELAPPHQISERGESNPRFLLGKQAYYHYTTLADLAWRRHAAIALVPVKKIKKTNLFLLYGIKN